MNNLSNQFRMKIYTGLSYLLKMYIYGIEFENPTTGWPDQQKSSE